MQKIFFTLFLLSCFGKLSSQEIQYINFRHMGIRIGREKTLSIRIRTGSIASPLQFDDPDIRRVLTDSATFESIKKFVNSAHYLVKVYSKIKIPASYYLIWSTFKENMCLGPKYLCKFFDSLSDSLKKGDFDVNVIDALQFYGCNQK